MKQPLAIDLFCGLGGWSEALIDEGYFCAGFDIERHEYDGARYPGSLVIQDVLTLHGSQFKDAALIVASPPCQEFSYMAMPWSKAKEKQRKIAESPEEQKRLTALFDACFRIQREACEAAGRHIPMVVENVRGAQKWVGRARWNYGSFYLWGDVPALMPSTVTRGIGPGVKRPGRTMCYPAGSSMPDVVKGRTGQLHWQDGIEVGQASERRWEDRPVKRLRDAFKGEVAEGRKGAGAGAEWFDQNLCKLSSRSNSRKAASAQIAKIPAILARHIAITFMPKDIAA